MDQNITSGNSTAALGKHVLLPLPYNYSALEPFIDVQTMTVHHDKHHASYVDKLNEALAQHPELQSRSVPWLLRNLESVPETIRTAVRNNGGGHLNHTMFWRGMKPGGSGTPTGALASAIDASFGGFDQFKTKFDETGAKVFGSGWVWLVSPRSGQGKLEIVTTPGHDTPLKTAQPIVVNDVWEHAYYLKHQNRRPEYLKTWWSLVDWNEAARRFENPQTPELLENADGSRAA